MQAKEEDESWRRIVEREADTSAWLAGLPKFQGSETIPDSASVVVIGAGFTGASCAYWLKRCGVSGHVAVLEQRPSVSHGATGRNGGHLWPSVQMPQDKTPEALEQLKKVTQFKIENFHLVCQFIEENNVDCDFLKNGAVSVARNAEEAEEERGYMDFMLENGMDMGFEWWDAERCNKELNSTKYVGGCYQKMAAKLYPAKLVHAIAEEALSYGQTSFHFNAKVVNLKLNSVGSDFKYTVITEGGNTIRADVIIHATNAWAASLFSSITEKGGEDEEGKETEKTKYSIDCEVIKPTRGQALLTSSFHLPSGDRMDWSPNMSFDDGWQYMIQRKDGKIVLGGMRWVSPTGEEYTLDDSKLNCELSERLHQFLLDNFTGISEVTSSADLTTEKGNYVVEREWTGIMAFTKDEHPLVGLLPPVFREGLGEEKGGVKAGQYISAGYTGNGMALAFASGKAIAEMITGRLSPNDLPACFAPDRFQ